MRILCLVLAAVCFLTILTSCAPVQTSPETSLPTMENTETPQNAPVNSHLSTYIPNFRLPDQAVLPDPNQADADIPQVWTAHCSQCIYLRSTPTGRIIATILKGEKVQVLNWERKYAQVIYNGMTGYVPAANLLPENTQFLQDCLDTVKLHHIYSYSQLLADLEALCQRHPDIVTVETIGASTQGRDIPVLRIGDPNAEYHILVQGAIHGREYATAWLVTAMADYWLDHEFYTYRDVCLHIIPMANPDGVTISQAGVLDSLQQNIYLSDIENDHTILYPEIYAARWKANAQGVDINRNFPAGWSKADDRDGPSSQNYRGSEPFSTPEAVALRDYTLRHSFDVTLSYHASGSVIYWFYGKKAEVNQQSLSLALAVEGVTGYPPEKNTLAIGAGYKDWAMDALEIPSLTVEIGYGEAPLAPVELYSIFARNYQVLPTVAQWVRQNHD